ncbi:hypothetical protein GCM10011390_03410 [Aureimonas endophytica]|uniref:Uncharacterized protein n=1 Tax=Aureimonas endophytica TaxID=2027858 RepID=A0A916ZCG3_9HYPH|nr:hypothetical protein [Aureimonas endophytica]GGD87965.1 hypothetical protein GCM10011390_03410 [Aureimonas endophytica]
MTRVIAAADLLRLLALPPETAVLSSDDYATAADLFAAIEAAKVEREEFVVLLTVTRRVGHHQRRPDGVWTMTEYQLTPEGTRRLDFPADQG